MSIKPHLSRRKIRSSISAIPGFGLQATREGVTEMIKRCAEHLDDPEVAQLMDSVNAKLGFFFVLDPLDRRFCRALVQAKCGVNQRTFGGSTKVT